MTLKESVLVVYIINYKRSGKVCSYVSRPSARKTVHVSLNFEGEQARENRMKNFNISKQDTV